MTERKAQEHDKLEQKKKKDNKHSNTSSHKENYLGLPYGLIVTQTHSSRNGNLQLTCIFFPLP